ncbi:MAG: CHAD domain-containing protein, partial [Mesorhizobium sp.]
DKAGSRGEADDFHDLRKAAKTHSMHLSLLGRLWPTPIKARRKAVDKTLERRPIADFNLLAERESEISPPFADARKRPLRTDR